MTEQDCNNTNLGNVEHLSDREILVLLCYRVNCIEQRLRGSSSFLRKFAVDVILVAVSVGVTYFASHC